jgi:hypothetical protein
MKKLFLFIFVFLASSIYLLSSTPPVKAESIEPFAPFSVEGNPDEDYHFEELFPLLKYIRPRALKIFENRDRSRTYDPYMLCPGGDGRDYVCSVDNQSGDIVDTCDGGPVDICNRISGDYVKTVESGPNNSCNAHPDPEKAGVSKGRCSYKKRPGISNTVKGTDFSGQELVFPSSKTKLMPICMWGCPKPYYLRLPSPHVRRR